MLLGLLMCWSFVLIIFLVHVFEWFWKFRDSGSNGESSQSRVSRGGETKHEQ